ncbi:MAG TPA: YhjD/YihY/BrkB family envelope integrity protein [candidate division Zixibacteria bacterium]|nr:YhjD/YihY/BrkB family envelope integrity protein [candidate division Zixibacteria bacterium]
MSASSTKRGRSIRELKSRVLDRVWEAEPEQGEGPWRWLTPAARIALMVGRDFVENLVKLQAMALAFKTLLSLAPLLAVVFSLLKAFGVHNRMEPALAEALAPLGEKGREITDHLIAFVDRMSAGALGSVGLVTLLLTVVSLMTTIEQAFNHIWRVKTPRKIARRFSDYLSVALVGPVLVFAAVTVMATLQSSTFVRTLMALEPLGTVILTLLGIVPYLTVWGAFSFMYLFVPNTRVQLKSALIGGAVGALLWATVGWGFAVFVASSTRYYAIYSSFAILLLFLLWLHVGWVIVLLGCQVAYAHQHFYYYYRGDRGTLAQTAAGREKLALLLMVRVGQAFCRGLPPLTATALAADLQVPAWLVREFMETLSKTNLVAPLADEESFVLARDPATIGVKEILDCVRYGGDHKAAPKGPPEDRGVDSLLGDVERSVAKALEGKNLRSLIDQG